MAVAEAAELICSQWSDARGKRSRLSPADIMVVVPYNDQVALLRQRLDANRKTRGVRAGRVDKFQGQEAPVVFFSMTTSSSADMRRGPEVLSFRERLSVAISRARCLAYLVCTEQLPGSRPRDQEEMRLIGTLCAFVEYSQRAGGGS